MVHECSPFEALQSGINRIPVAIRQTTRKCGKSGNLKVMTLTFVVGVVASISICYMYYNNMYSSRYISTNIVCRL